MMAVQGSTATDRVLNVPELLDLILEELPLPALLRSRRVSRSWQESIQNTWLYRSIKSNPRINMDFELPNPWPISKFPRLQVFLTLQYDQPVTICKFPSCITRGIQGFAYRVEQDVPRLDNTLQRHTSNYGNRVLRRNVQHRWSTLLPGVPYRYEWPFRNHHRVGVPMGDLAGRQDIGKHFTLFAFPGCDLRGYVGTKEHLLLLTDNGEGIEQAPKLDLPLVGDPQLHYSVVE